MPMGPITLYDVVGIDVAVHAGRTMAAAFPDRVVPAPIVDELFERGRIGKKRAKASSTTARRKAASRRRGTDSPEVAQLIDECRTGEKRKFSQEEITDRLFLPMLVEATRVLEDNIVTDVRDVDLGLISASGFHRSAAGCSSGPTRWESPKSSKNSSNTRRSASDLNHGDADRTRRSDGGSTIKLTQAQRHRGNR